MDSLHRPELRRLNIELETEEVVFEVIHKHWGKVLFPAITLGFFFLISVGVIFFLLTSQTASSQGFLGVLGLSLVWYLGLIGYAISEWHGFRHSALIVTSQRIVDCQQLSILARRLQTIDIHEIQSCSGGLESGLGILLSYGDIWINTIGDKPICITHIPLPEVVAGYIMHYHNLVAHGGMNLHPTPAIDPTEVPISQRDTTDTSENPALPTKHALPVSTIDRDPFEIATYDSIESSTAVADPIATEPPQTATQAKQFTLLMFCLPSELLTTLWPYIPALKEPSVTYLQQSDYYEVEIIIPLADLPQTVSLLKEKGAENIMSQPINRVEYL